MLMLSPQRTLALLAALTLSACAGRQPGAPIKPGMNFFSAQQDIELGKQAAEEVRQQMDIVKNQALQDAVRRVGDRLAATTPAGSGGLLFNFTDVVLRAGKLLVGRRIESR